MDYKFFAYFYSSNPFPPVRLKHQVSTLFTRELSSRDSWTQTPNSNFLMLGSDFLGSVRPLKFKQYYLQHCEKTPPTNRCTSQGTASATSWDPHSSTPTAFLQAASLKIISFKAMFSARHLPFPRLPGKFQPCCPSIPYIRLFSGGTMWTHQNKQAEGKVSMLAAVLPQHTGTFHLVLGLLSQDALHQQPAAPVNTETSSQTQNWEAYLNIGKKLL